jgi:predicted RNA-binding protein with PIN domain
MQKIIIDGYNLIHADPGLRRTAARAMDEARRSLLERVRAYLSERRVQVTVVFDGAGGLVDAEALVPGRLQVLYSAGGQTADEVIVETLESHPNPRQYIVVTSDMADIGRRVRAIGAVVMPSSEFLGRMAGPGTAGRDEGVAGGHRSEKPDPAGEDIDYWLRQFGAGEEKSGDRDD